MVALVFKLKDSFLLLLMYTWTLVFIPVVSASPAEFDRAVQLYNAGKYADSLKQLSTLDQLHMSSDSSRYYKALCYQALNQMDAAAEQYRWLLSNSKDPEIRDNAETGLRQIPHTKPVINVKDQCTKQYSASGYLKGGHIGGTFPRIGGAVGLKGSGSLTKTRTAERKVTLPSMSEYDRLKLKSKFGL